MKDDLAVIQAVLAGNTDAFEVIVKRYEGMVATIVRNMIDNEDAAADVGQEVFIRLYRSLDRFRGNAALSTYIGKIAVNLSLNELKRLKGRRTDPLETADKQRDIQASRRYDQVENRELISMALKRLPDKFRTVIVLRMIEGYSTSETGEILGIPDGTVLSRLARAQDKLRKALEAIGYTHNT